MTTAGTTAPLTLIAAPFTAFHADGGLNLDAVAAQADQLRGSGVDGVFVGGSTGEFASMTIDERTTLAEEWRRHAGTLRLIIHVGATSAADARELAAHAQSIGADGIAAVPPYYFRPANLDRLTEVMAEIASGAPDLPFLYYHIPAMTRVELPMNAFLARAKAAIPTFRGIKFTDGNLLELADCLDAHPDLEIMYGKDTQLFPAMLLGCSAAVGSTYNIAAEVYREGAKALAEGDLAGVRAAAQVSRDIVDTANRFGGPAAQKAIYGLTAVDCGPSRAPFPPMTDEAIAEFRALIARGFTAHARQR